MTPAGVAVVKNSKNATALEQHKKGKAMGPERWWRSLRLLVCMSCLMSSTWAWSQAVVFGQVVRVKGMVQVTSIQGQAQTLQQGQAVHVGDQVTAAADGEAVLKTTDGGWVAVRPASAWVVEQFRYQNDLEDTQVLKLIKGGLRIITGQLGTKRPERQLLKTNTATIGIRGTDHEPYVLERAQGNYPAGTYDRVRSGATSLTSDTGSLNLAAGQVGMVAAQPRGARAMLTLLLPSLLEQVPDFFIPGTFDGELDSWTGSSLPESGRIAKRIHTQSKTSKTGNALASDGMSCHASPTSIATQWLAQLDAAIEQRQAKAALALFTADARLQVRVLRRNGTYQTVTLHRDELVESTWAALSKLSNYRHQRNAPEAEAMPMPDTPCPAIRVRSEVEESGQMNGQAYRMRAIERYVLEYQQGRWVASLSETQQQ